MFSNEETEKEEGRGGNKEDGVGSCRSFTGQRET